MKTGDVRLLDIVVYDALTAKQHLDIDAYTKNGASPSNEAMGALLSALLAVVEEVEAEAVPARGIRPPPERRTARWNPPRTWRRIASTHPFDEG